MCKRSLHISPLSELLSDIKTLCFGGFFLKIVNNGAFFGQITVFLLS